MKHTSYEETLQHKRIYVYTHTHTHTYIYMKYADEKDSWRLAP